MFIVDKNIDYLKYPPFDDPWKEKMVSYCNDVYSTYSYYSKIYNHSEEISSFFMFIYKSLQYSPENINLKEYIRIFSKKIMNIIDKEYDFYYIENEIDNTYQKFLDLFNPLENLKYSKNFMNAEHLANGYVIGTFLNISPFLACFLNPYIYTSYDSIFINYMYINSCRIHYIFHDSFGFLKTKFDIGPGYCYLYMGYEKEKSRYDKNSGKKLMFLWKNNFLLKF